MPADQSTVVLLGLGSNLGETASHLSAARAGIRKLAPQLRCSSLFRSQPVGHSAQPYFLNMVCVARSLTPPGELLQQIHHLENQLGRVRSFLNSPRIIDIDILAYGDLVLDTPALILPHPRLHQRAFTLVPLMEVAPEWRHPVFHKTAEELLAAAGSLEKIDRVGPLPQLHHSP